MNDTHNGRTCQADVVMGRVLHAQEFSGFVKDLGVQRAELARQGIPW